MTLDDGATGIGADRRRGSADRDLCDGQTEVVDACDRSIRLAASLLQAGHIVGIPTETVYGLAADAANPDAVARVFAAKRRPSDHPLIVHLGEAASLSNWARRIPPQASRLADAFWPGPLTLVLDRHPSVLDAVTGGQDTVALRMPAHPVAQQLLRVFGGGLAAPSANIFGRVSPTTAHDVCAALGGAVGLVVDGGPCEVGVESTIVALEGEEVAILRPGGVSPEAIAAVLGRRARTATLGAMRAPGMLASHYAPATVLDLCSSDDARARAAELISTGMRVGVLSLARIDVSGAAVAWDAGGEMAVFARSLYQRLRQADDEGLDVLVVALPPDAGLGTAIRDRLRRAAHRPQMSGKGERKR
ncbi:MAG: L-threonylcarbamoyladenylate synthase [Actinomycetota bacterium]|nr:L-threonylcarbamoyladenylate synthase [Actinomycetota bacterium]